MGGDRKPARLVWRWRRGVSVLAAAEAELEACDGAQPGDGRLPEPEMRSPRVGQPGRHKWVFAMIWLVYMVDPLTKVVHADHSPAWKVLNYSVTALFAVVYAVLCMLVYPHEGEVGAIVRTPRLGVPLLLAMGTIALVSSLAVNPELGGMWVYVGVAAGLALPLKGGAAYRGVLAVFGLMTLTTLVSTGSFVDWGGLALPTFFAGASTIGIRQLGAMIVQLREAREAVARLAANEERLRLARDLHDLTGHSLSMITLKAELAQRMLHRARAAAGPDPDSGLDAALKEVGEIEQVSRQTLTDIRQAVSGYRRATLAVETASASAALEAADIAFAPDPSVPAADTGLHPDHEAALAWTLREAVTNAIRHSGASRVTVRLDRTADEVLLTVGNDGRGLAAAVGEADAFGGNGLAGLRERLDAVGGRLTVGGPDGDFRVVAAVPDRAAEAVAPAPRRASTPVTDPRPTKMAPARG